MSTAPTGDAAGKAGAETRVTFVGHSTVAIEAAGTLLLTDPLLRGRLLGLLRRRAALPSLGAVGRPDAVLISHLHYDHLDLPSLRSLPSGTPIVAPRGSRRFLGSRGFHDVVELSEGEGMTIGGLRVVAVPARHGRGGRPGAGRVGSLGYVVEAKARVYFAGDTQLFDEMRAIGDRLDCALLPIWGWGPRLGPGHLDPFAAAESLRLLEPRLAVPIHWGTYTPVGAPRLWPWLASEAGRRFARDAARLAPEVEVRLLAVGESLALGPGAQHEG
jgi:L-ascorbate metabolism protein UlaG (beta-lactamase superfamily)